MTRFWRSVAAALFACGWIAADDEASNRPVVKSDEWGGCYAKSVPTESYGSKGTTSVYSVRPVDDVLLHKFDWYANRIYLNCSVGRPNQQTRVSVVQFGPWARGQRASSGDLALAFYFDGKLVRRYSTLDIAGSTDNVSASVSHYQVIERVDGYRWQKENFQTFEVTASDGRRLVFDPTTGEMLSSSKPSR